MTEEVRWIFDAREQFYTATIGASVLRVWQTMLGKWTGVVLANQRVQTQGGFMTREEAQVWAEEADTLNNP